MPYANVAIAHLSGLAGYLIPFAGVLFPIVIWIVKSDSPVISSIAKQAILLNVVAFLLAGVGVVLAFTLLLLPLAILLWCVLGLAALLLPIVGAVKASEGIYFKYPVVGVAPVQPQSSGRSPAGAIFTIRGEKRAIGSTRSACAAITASMSL